jgi:hypothetical protein
MVEPGPAEAGEQMAMMVSTLGDMVEVIGSFLHPEQRRIVHTKSALRDVNFDLSMEPSFILYSNLLSL